MQLLPCHCLITSPCGALHSDTSGFSESQLGQASCTLWAAPGLEVQQCTEGQSASRTPCWGSSQPWGTAVHRVPPELSAGIPPSPEVQQGTECFQNSLLGFLPAQRYSSAQSASRTSSWDSSQPWGMLSWSCFSVWVLPCLARRDWAVTGCSHSHFSGPAGVFERVWGDLSQAYIAEMEILTNDQKTFPTCFVALLNPSSLQGKNPHFFSFFFFPC